MLLIPPSSKLLSGHLGKWLVDGIYLFSCNFLIHFDLHDMNIKHRASMLILAIGLLIAMSGCYPKCNCNDQGCFEGMCECFPGYIGRNCELLAGDHLAANYSAVAISQNNDTVIYASSISANTSDLTRCSFSNFHGLSTVEGTFGPTSVFEAIGGNWSIASQPIGSSATVSGYGYHFESDGHLEISYTIADSAGSVQWTAVFTR